VNPSSTNKNEIYQKIEKVVTDVSLKFTNLNFFLKQCNKRNNDIDFSLAGGLSGACVLFGELDFFYPNDNWDMVGHQYLMKLKEIIEKKDITSLSTLCGLGSIGFAILSLSKNGERYIKFQESFNNYYLSKLKKYLQKIKIQCKNEDIDFGVFETIYGLSGIGRYILCFSDNEQMLYALKDILKLIVNMARNILKHGYSIPGWFVIDKEENTPTNIKFDCGLSHGISGPLSLLSICLVKGIVVKGQYEAVLKISEWLTNKITKDHNGLYFPNYITFEQELKNETDNSPTRDAWCYGSPGICNTLVLAGNQTHLKFVNTSESVFKDIIKRSFIIQKNFSPTLCHGLSGLLTITMLINKCFENDQLASYEKLLVNEILNYYNKENLLGFQNIEFIPGKGFVSYDNIGMLNGAIGVLLALLAFMNKKTYTDWECLLLLK